jgi:hypothetical protein
MGCLFRAGAFRFSALSAPNGAAFATVAAIRPAAGADRPGMLFPTPGDRAKRLRICRPGTALPLGGEHVESADLMERDRAIFWKRRAVFSARSVRLISETSELGEYSKHLVAWSPRMRAARGATAINQTQAQNTGVQRHPADSGGLASRRPQRRRRGAAFFFPSCDLADAAVLLPDSSSNAFRSRTVKTTPSMRLSSVRYGVMRRTSHLPS